MTAARSPSSPARPSSPTRRSHPRPPSRPSAPTEASIFPVPVFAPTAVQRAGRVVHRRQPHFDDRRLQGHDRLGRRHPADRRHDQPAGRRRHGVHRQRHPHLRRFGCHHRTGNGNLPDPGVRRGRRRLDADRGQHGQRRRQPDRPDRQLNPKSDSGLSTGTVDTTNVTQPDFFGTSEPFSTRHPVGDPASQRDSLHHRPGRGGQRRLVEHQVRRAAG